MNEAKLDDSVGRFDLSFFKSTHNLGQVSASAIRYFHIPAERTFAKWPFCPAEVVIAPPALYLLLAREHLRKGIEVAAQNVFDRPNGAFTGEISVEQLRDSDITWTLVGHSERRVVMGEDDAVGATVTGQRGFDRLRGQG